MHGPHQTVNLILGVMLLAAAFGSPAAAVVAPIPGAEAARAPGSAGGPAAPAGSYGWTPLGPYGGAVSALAFSPQFASDRTVFSAVYDGAGQGQGVFRSVDGGVVWTPANQGIFSLQAAANVTALAISPGFAVDRTLYAATGAGLLRSGDGGGSWAVISATLHAARLAISPHFAADGLLLASDGSANVYRSADRGQTWLKAGYCCGDGLAISPEFAADGVVLAGRSRSTDGGRSFTEVIHTTESAHFAFSPGYAGDGRVFAGTGQGRILVSSDRGATWGQVGSVDSGVVALAVSPAYAADHTLWAGVSGRGLLRSADGGGSWAPAAGLAAGDTAKALAASPDYAGDGLLLVGARSGLYRSRDGGGRLSAGNLGLLGLAATRVAVSAGFAADHTLFADAGHALYRSTDGGYTWIRLRAGSQDLVLAALSPAFPGDHTVFAQLAATGELMRSQDGGVGWDVMAQPVLSGPPSVWAISPQYAADHTLWAAAQVSSSGWVGQLARSGDGGQTWDPPVEIGRALYVNALALSPAFAADGTALAGTELGGLGGVSSQGLAASADGGGTWPFKTLSSTCIDQHACFPADGWAVAFSPAYAGDRTAFAGTRGSGVYRNTAGVSHPDGWAPVTFPSTRTVASLAVSPAFAADGRVWAGTLGQGVFAAADGGRQWSALNDGLGDWRVHDLAPSPAFAADQTLFAATESGIWVYSYRPLPPQPPPLPAAISATIGPEGGSLDSNDADASTTIVVGQGALTASTVITYACSLPTATGSLAGTGHFFRLEAAQAGQPLPRFSHPVTVTVRYTGAERGGAVEPTLRLYGWDGSNWSTAGITTTGHTAGIVSSAVDHFSLFALLGETRRAYLPVLQRAR